jgi:hypothetical protein
LSFFWTTPKTSSPASDAGLFLCRTARHHRLQDGHVYNKFGNCQWERVSE